MLAFFSLPVLGIKLLLRQVRSTHVMPDAAQSDAKVTKAVRTSQRAKATGVLCCASVSVRLRRCPSTRQSRQAIWRARWVLPVLCEPVGAAEGVFRGIPAATAGAGRRGQREGALLLCGWCDACLQVEAQD